VEDDEDIPVRSPRAPGLRKDGSARPTLQKVQRANGGLDVLLQKSGAKIPAPASMETDESVLGSATEKTKKEPIRRSTIHGDARRYDKEEIEKYMPKTTKNAGDIEVPQPLDGDLEKKQASPKKTDNDNKLNFSNCSFIGMDTDPGKRYGKLNQDAHLYCRTGKYGHVAAVFDGHGVNGEVAANISRDTFKQYFSEFDFWAYSVEKRKEQLTKLFNKTHEIIIKTYASLATIKWEGHKFQLENIRGLMMYKNKKFGALLQDFGTTAVVAIINTDEKGKVVDIMCANVGDSIAFVGRESTKNNLGLRAMHGLIEMHNGANEEEEERITAKGSRLTDGDYVAPPEDSGFGWAQLAVTRSLGHRYFSEYGVISEPFISDYQVNHRDRFLVITSDGVTDVLSSKEILKVVKEHVSTGPPSDMQHVATKLVKHSLAMWRKRFGEEGEPADNTTAIVIDLKGFNPKRNTETIQTECSSHTPPAVTTRSELTPTGQEDSPVPGIINNDSQDIKNS